MNPHTQRRSPDGNVFVDRSDSSSTMSSSATHHMIVPSLPRDEMMSNGQYKRIIPRYLTPGTQGNTIYRDSGGSVLVLKEDRDCVLPSDPLLVNANNGLYYPDYTNNVSCVLSLLIKEVITVINNVEAN